MKEYFLKRKIWLARPLDEVFDFFANAENLGLITPPELGFRIVSKVPIEMRSDTLIDYTIRLFRFPMRWRTAITRWSPPESFEDTQLSGPYAKWVHTHSFTPFRGGTTVEDRIVYALPFGLLGRIAHPLVKAQLRRIFNYRERVLVDRFAPRGATRDHERVQRLSGVGAM